MTQLRGKARRYLRSLGNQLRPTVYLGKEGISPALLRSIDEAHAYHELIKIKIERSCPLNRKEAGDHLAAATKSSLVQVLGNTVLLYRPDPDEPKIALPEQAIISATVYDTPIGSYDIPPTFISRAGMDPLWKMHGQDLSLLLSNPNTEWNYPLLMENTR